MILAKMHGGKLLVIGLSRENLRRLGNGDPIFINSKDHPGIVSEGDGIFVMGCETEHDMIAEFRKKGIIQEGKTDLRIDPLTGN